MASSQTTGRRRRPLAQAANPLPALLVGVGLAWMAFSKPRPAGQAAGRPGGGDDRRPDGAPDPATGAHAERPGQIPARGWKEVLWRVKDEISNDNIGIIAAGCAFYALLSLFPAITALVSIYGLVADPATIENQLGSLAGVLPEEALNLIRDQAHSVASSESTALGWGALLALFFTLYTASSGISTLFTALNVAYEEEEKRGIVAFYLTTFAFTIGAIIAAIVGLGIIVGVPAVLKLLPLGPLVDWGVRLGSWAVLIGLLVLGLAVIYRWGPSRATARWNWVTPGSIAAAVLWLVASLGFSFYAANFASYNETYGTLGGVIILLMWLWISAYVILLGAELNSELELQTEADTTTGPARPIGERDAFVADHGPHQRAAAAAP